jgi:hypothetical protein
MTIQEAIKSGKPFRRKRWTGFYARVGKKPAWYVRSPSRANGNDTFYPTDGFSVREILATDWKVKP